MKEHVTLQAIFQGARTTIDGGWRLSFDLDASQAELVTQVARMTDLLRIDVTPVGGAKDFNPAEAWEDPR